MIHFDHESVGGFMRGRFRDQGGLFSYLSPEARVPAKHPLRQGRELVRAVLKDLSPSFGKLYSSAGRPSIPPEQLLSALLLQVFYGIRSERQLMEQLDYNLLYRWFAGLAPDDPVWDTTTFTKNRDRLQHGEVFQKFMTNFGPRTAATMKEMARIFAARNARTRRMRARPIRRAVSIARRRAGGEALLHGSCHHGEPARACGGRGRHKGRWHGGTAPLASHAESQAQGRWSSHHGRRGQGL